MPGGYSGLKEIEEEHLRSSSEINAFCIAESWIFSLDVGWQFYWSKKQAKINSSVVSGRGKFADTRMSSSKETFMDTVN